MIIGGEKVPAFSATTLSIPHTPKDNFDAIVAHSRANYARPRAAVEAEIKETIEQSEKYKKELSDSGRQEVLMVRPEQKPNFKYQPKFPKNPTPQGDMIKQKISPNAAEGKESLGLKDLAKLAAAKEAENKENQAPRKNNSKKRRKGK